MSSKAATWGSTRDGRAVTWADLSGSLRVDRLRDSLRSDADHYWLPPSTWPRLGGNAGLSSSYGRDLQLDCNCSLFSLGGVSIENSCRLLSG